MCLRTASLAGQQIKFICSQTESNFLQNQTNPITDSDLSKHSLKQTASESFCPWVTCSHKVCQSVPIPSALITWLDQGMIQMWLCFGVFQDCMTTHLCNGSHRSECCTSTACWRLKCFPGKRSKELHHWHWEGTDQDSHIEVVSLLHQVTRFYQDNTEQQFATLLFTASLHSDWHCSDCSVYEELKQEENGKCKNSQERFSNNHMTLTLTQCPAS